MSDPDPRAMLGPLLAADGRTLVELELVQVEAGRHGPLRGYAVTWSDGTGQRGSDLVYLDPAPESAADPALDPAAGTPAGYPAGDPVAPDGVGLRDPATGARYRVWRYPEDPALPALAPAVHLDAVAALLPRLGEPAAPTALALMAYRPGRRAVVRVLLETGGAVYLKVVRPAQVELVHAKHRTLADAGVPVPSPRGWSPAGLLALAEVPGAPAAHHLPGVVADPGFLPALAGLLARFAGAVRADWPARRTPAAAVDFYAEHLTRARPDLAGRVGAVAAAVRAAPRRDPVGSHGDLHLGQVMVDPDRPGRVLGLLDVDTAGPGDPADDGCALVAQLVVTALTAADDAERAAARTAAATWPTALSPVPLRPRLAGHLLALALDPATRDDAATAEALLAAAERATTPHEDALISPS